MIWTKFHYDGHQWHIVPHFMTHIALVKYWYIGKNEQKDEILTQGIHFVYLKCSFLVTDHVTIPHHMIQMKSHEVQKGCHGFLIFKILVHLFKLIKK